MRAPVTSEGTHQDQLGSRQLSSGPADLSVLLLGDHAVVDLLQTIVSVAVGVLPVLNGVSVTLATGASSYQTTNASSARIRSVDESQYASDSGPCIDAIVTGREVTAAIPALAWPEFSAAATDESIRSVWSLPLTVEQRPTGALNLYSSSEAPWQTPAAEPVRLLARQAAAVLQTGMALVHNEHVNLTLRRALETRTVIGQAQGVLMARQAITPDEAFDILRRASQRTNRKLRDVAAEIVEGVSQGRQR